MSLLVYSIIAAGIVVVLVEVGAWLCLRIRKRR